MAPASVVLTDHSLCVAHKRGSLTAQAGYLGIQITDRPVGGQKRNKVSVRVWLKTFIPSMAEFWVVARSVVW